MIRQAPRTVAILQPRLSHYRVPFYQALRPRLERHGIACRVIYGLPAEQEKAKQDAGTLDWGIEIRNRDWRVGPLRLTYQPCLEHLRDADLVIVQQENRMLLNYWLALRRRLAGRKLALWGHGANLQAAGRTLRERWKRLFATRCDWWFAYTDVTRELVLGCGFSADRVTVVHNACDTRALQAWRDSIGPGEVEALRAQLGLRGRHVGVYIGSLYAVKQLGFLLEAAGEIRRQVSDFELVVIGAGPDELALRRQAAGRSWIHLVGPRHARDKVLHLALGRVMLIPFGVGLAALDSFAMSLPLVAVRGGGHGPEIAYVQPEVNGLLTPPDPRAYAAAVADLQASPARLEAMGQACLEDAQRYTVERMADNFACGVVRAMET